MSYKDSRHLVLDIETLGVEKNAPIIQIGAAMVWDGQIQASFSTNVDFKSCLDVGLTNVDVETLLWWMEKGNRLHSIISEPKLSIYSAVMMFRKFIDKHKPDYFWGCSHDFDFGLIGAAYEKIGIEPDWKFYQLRDIRTLRDEAFIDMAKVKKNPHDAQIDAWNEAEILINAVWKRG